MSEWVNGGIKVSDQDRGYRETVSLRYEREAVREIQLARQGYTIKYKNRETGRGGVRIL